MGREVIGGWNREEKRSYSEKNRSDRIKTDQRFSHCPFRNSTDQKRQGQDTPHNRGRTMAFQL
jgi:hypothetical protein